MRKKLAFIILAILILGCSKQEPKDLSLSRIVSKGNIVYGYKKGSPPLIFKENSLERGFIPEFLKVFEKEFGVKVLFKEIDEKTFLLDSLNSGEVDFLIEQNIYKENPLFMMSKGVLNLPLSSISGKNDSNKKKFIYAVTSQKNCFLEEFCNHIPVPSPNPILSIKEEGLLVLNEGTSQWFAQKLPNDFSEKPLPQSLNFCFMVRQGEKKLLDAINIALDRTLAKLKIKKLSRKWFGAERNPRKFF